MAAQDHPAHGPFLTLAQNLGQDGIAVLRGQAVGHQVESAAGEQRRVELLGIDKAFQGQGALLGGAQRLQLGLIDDDVLLGGIGIAGDDGAGLDLAVNGTMLFIADALAAAGMELVEVDLLAGAGGGVGLDGDGHQAELQQARPTGAATGAGGTGQGW